MVVEDIMMMSSTSTILYYILCVCKNELNSAARRGDVLVVLRVKNIGGLPVWRELTYYT